MATAALLTTFTQLNLETIVLGNTMRAYVYALVVFAVLTLLFKIVQFVVLRRLGTLAKRTDTDIDDTFISIVNSLKPAFYYFVAFFFATKTLALSALAADIVYGILVVWVVYQIIVGVQILVDYALKKRIGTKADANTKAAVGYISVFAKIGLWTLGILMVLSNFGINVTSLIAGLGIGGVAIAFALQNILADLFSSFAIYFDKPFQVGDFIVIGNSMGTVEKIGIKTTRLRALSGEELVISNKELTAARVQNFKRLKERRVAFTVGVVYETPQQKVREIPEMIKKVIETAPNARFERSHFREFGDSALLFETVYYVRSNDYTEYMNAQQDINLKLFDVFEKEGISFAYPTQTLYVQK